MRTLCLVLILSMTALAAPGAESLQLFGSPRPGAVLYLTLAGAPAGTRATATLGGDVYTFCEGRSGLSVPVAISANEKPGKKTLEVTVVSPTGQTRRITRIFTVKAYRFRKEYLSMSRANEAKYTAPSVEKEDAMVRAVRDEVIPRQLWTKPFAMPVGGSLGTRFGVRRIVNGKDNDYHGGQDVRAAMGRPIRAMNDGVVVLAETGFVLRGKTVTVNHGQGLTTTYMHMSALAVKKGQKVARGQTIGYAGSTGASTGPHLHFAAYCGRTPFDPLLLLDPPATWLAP